MRLRNLLLIGYQNFKSYRKGEKMENSQKQVYFDKFCKTCQNEKLDESKDPCNECLDNPVNANCRVPVMYKDKEKSK